MNDTEKKFETEASKRGFKILHKGFPDYLVMSPNGDFIFFVEVKSNSQPYLTPEQQEMGRILKQAGIPVAISRDGKWPDELIKMRKLRASPLTRRNTEKRQKEYMRKT